MKHLTFRAPVLAAALVGFAIGVPTLAAQADPAPAAPGHPAELLRYTGDASSATGAALGQGSCDVNGDDYADAVVGAWFWDKTPTANIGASYVILGSPDAASSSLADPADANAVRIDGPSTANAFTGFSVACVGDVNGDGLDDIAISHYIDQRIYVVFGAENFVGVTLDSLGDRGYTVRGGPDSGNVGYAIAPVGDVNADGLDDFAVSEVAADNNGRNNSGRIWVLAGRDDITDVNLLDPAVGQVIMTVDGAYAEERLGVSASVGDVNGDGIDDFLLGSYTSTPWGPAVAVPGAAYVVFGGATGALDAADLGTKGFSIVGPHRQRDRLGISVAAAGDVNGDGLADVLIGADGVNNATTGPRTGGAAIVFGSASTATVYTDPSAAPGQSVFTCDDDPLACAAPVRRGYWINGINGGDSTGYSVAGIGDVDGDGIPDHALGAWGHDPEGRSNAGAAFVVHGSPTAIVQNLDAIDGYQIDGLAAGDRFGRQVAAIGDFDGNGTDDLAIGADFAARGGAQNGEVTVALLGQLNTSTTLHTSETKPATGQTVFFLAGALDRSGQPLTSGTVNLTDNGQPVPGCTRATVSDGWAGCITAWSDRGDHAMVASYAGTDHLAPSSSAATDLTVGSAVVIDADPVVGSYGLLGPSVTGEVRAPGRLPTGTVTVSYGATDLGTATLSGGRFSLPLGVTAIPPGKRQLTLTYDGDARHQGTTGTTSTNVARAMPTVATVLSGRKVVIQVSAPGVKPTGTVQIKVDGKIVTTRTLRANGKTSATLPVLTRGSHRIWVVYTGTSTVIHRSSTPITVVAK